MSSSDQAARVRPSKVLAAAVVFALGASLVPLFRVVEGDEWTLGAFLAIALIVLTGYISRRVGLRAPAVTLLEVAAWVVWITLLFGRDSALLGVIPTLDTLRTVPGLLDVAFDQIRNGAAPLDAGTGLAFVIIAATGLLAIIVDHIVVTARMPMLAAVLLIGVYLIPSIAVPREVDVVAFIVFAASLLILLRVETRTRGRTAPSAVPSTGSPAAASGVNAGAGVGATAVGIGAIAVIAALVVAPVAPPAVPSGNGIGGMRGNTIDPNLSLGEDLRRPQELEVLRIHGSATSPPYLRAVTLSEFDGEEWQPDRGMPENLAEVGFEPLDIDPDIRVIEQETTIQIQNFLSPWLPIPYSATEIEGLDGDWSVVSQNRTLLSQSSSPQGQDYTVTYSVPRPTLEQIRAADTVLPSSSRTLSLAGDAEVIDSIRATALAVTASTSTDYDAALAMQRWFRSSEFEYSLDAPVEDGFDGTGIEAVARFLDAKQGYCVHFASAFAIMARTLDIPSRIVVGYLPGQATEESVDDSTVYSVSSTQLHAWPEVFFDGIGWIPFEPTNSLGVPTLFSSDSVGNAGDDPGIEPAPSTSASAAPSTGPDVTDPLDESASGDTAQRGPNALPAASITLLVVLVLALPGLIRAFRRRRNFAAIRAGDAAAAWREVDDTAIDLGVPLPAGESVRATGRRLVVTRGAPEDAVAVIVRAVELASYAPPAVAAVDGDALAAAVEELRAGMLEKVERRARVLAVIAPRSLVVRPGSGSAAEAR